MKFYYAPMEGITLYPLRNIHREVFGEWVDSYFTPFLTASHTHHFKNREKADVLPEKNTAFNGSLKQIVPQIMAANSENFIWAAGEMKKLGYDEVNLNLGCPAPTVVNRHKGAGLLAEPEYLDRMLSEIFDAVSGKETFPEISLKTRLGFSDPKEAETLMKIYAGYPVKELIIHARVREDYYAGAPRLDEFKEAVSAYRAAGGKADISYNGNIVDIASFERIKNELGIEASCSETQMGEVSSVMIGRGLLSDPSLVRQLKGGSALLPDELKRYLAKLYDAYACYIREDRNVIFKMLEHWAYLHVHFKDSDKCLKQIRKSRSRAEYHAAVNNIFAECEFV